VGLVHKLIFFCFGLLNLSAIFPQFFGHFFWFFAHFPCDLPQVFLFVYFGLRNATVESGCGDVFEKVLSQLDVFSDCDLGIQKANKTLSSLLGLVMTLQRAAASARCNSPPRARQTEDPQGSSCVSSSFQPKLALMSCDVFALKMCLPLAPIAQQRHLCV